MSNMKAFPDGLKWIECERGIGGKNSPIRYIPEQDPVQDALAKDKKTTYFKLTLPNMGSKLKVAIWSSGTPEQFVLHVRFAIHAIMQMGLDMDYAEAERAVEAAKLDAEIAKTEYATVRNSEKKKKGKQGEATGTSGTNPKPVVSPELTAAKNAYKKAVKAIEAAKLSVTMAGTKPFELYGNLFSDEARQPWDKIIQSCMTRAPWEDIKGVTHT
jgi:hypothetical protein